MCSDLQDCSGLRRERRKGLPPVTLYSAASCHSLRFWHVVTWPSRPVVAFIQSPALRRWVVKCISLLHSKVLRSGTQCLPSLHPGLSSPPPPPVSSLIVHRPQTFHLPPPLALLSCSFTLSTKELILFVVVLVLFDKFDIRKCRGLCLYSLRGTLVLGISRLQDQDPLQERTCGRYRAWLQDSQLYSYLLVYMYCAGFGPVV